MSSKLDWEEYRDLAQGVLNDLPLLPDKAEEFVTKLDEKLTSMIKWIEEEEHITESMADYISDKRAAVDQWLERLGFA